MYYLNAPDHLPVTAGDMIGFHPPVSRDIIPLYCEQENNIRTQTGQCNLAGIPLSRMKGSSAPVTGKTVVDMALTVTTNICCAYFYSR